MIERRRRGAQDRPLGVRGSRRESRGDIAGAAGDRAVIGAERRGHLAAGTRSRRSRRCRSVTEKVRSRSGAMPAGERRRRSRNRARRRDRSRPARRRAGGCASRRSAARAPPRRAASSSRGARSRSSRRESRAANRAARRRRRLSAISTMRRRQLGDVLEGRARREREPEREDLVERDRIESRPRCRAPAAAPSPRRRNRACRRAAYRRADARPCGRAPASCCCGGASQIAKAKSPFSRSTQSGPISS